MTHYPRSIISQSAILSKGACCPAAIPPVTSSLGAGRRYVNLSLLTLYLPLTEILKLFRLRKMWDLARDNLFSPPVLGFLLGMGARLLKSDLRLPEQLYTGLSIYLLFAIGLKGGGQLSSEHASSLAMPILGTIAVGVITPLIAFVMAKWLLNSSQNNRAALAAHYGSVSAVTFIVALQFLGHQKMSSESFFPALVAILEVIGIVVALLLAKSSQRTGSMFKILGHALTGQGVLLLIGGFLIGWASGKRGLDPLAPVFIDSFTGLLTLFLIQMGVLAGERLSEIKKHALRLVIFATVVPLIHAVIGVLIARWVGLSEGGALLFAIMAASASYIAAPAAVQSAIPDANPSLYVTASLGITFPFNLVVGIPLYSALISRIYS